MHPLPLSSGWCNIVPFYSVWFGKHYKNKNKKFQNMCPKKYFQCIVRKIYLVFASTCMCNHVHFLNKIPHGGNFRVIFSWLHIKMTYIVVINDTKSSSVDLKQVISTYIVIQMYTLLSISMPPCKHNFYPINI